jgi:hypothetical protein
MDGERSTFRSSLRAGVAASAAPYGYTITIWSSGAVSMDLLGKPRVGEALFYVLGAATAFLVLEIVAYGRLHIRLSSGPLPRMAAWGNAHLLSAGGAVLGVWAADHAFRRDLTGWVVAGFLATALYLSLNAVQATQAAAAAGSGD